MATGPIAVVPYDAEWPGRFETERALLESVLALWLDGGIHHIGSTAIPGIAAKPIIDMMAGVQDLEEAREAFDPLLEHSYLFAPHRRGEAHHFSKPSLRLPEMTHGLHLTRAGSDLWRERLAFRDALRADAALVAAYEALKRQALQEHPADVAAYTHAKRAFVARVLCGGRDSTPPEVTTGNGASSPARLEAVPADYGGADVSSPLAVFIRAAVGTASVLLAAWGIWLLIDPHEERHFEYAFPALLLAAVGVMTAVVVWRRAS
jgi:GrpB-like predicted nucleotidyltransferase (UPF0157 family)